MKKLLTRVVLPALAALLFWYMVSEYSVTVPMDRHSLLLIYHPMMEDEYGFILHAYESLFEEEGIAFDSLTPSALLSEEPEDVQHAHPVLVLPDGLARYLPRTLAYWLYRYVECGGHLAVIYDAGTVNIQKRYLKQTMMTPLLDLKYGRYDELKDRAYTRGYMEFKNEEVIDLLQIPPGKICDERYLCGYKKPRLYYPMSRTQATKDFSEKDVLAWMVDDQGIPFPGVVLKRIANGTVFYVNTPIGYLKAFGSDDMIARSLLRGYLFGIVKLPHLMNTPYGKGGLVWNWHLDDNREWKNTDLFISQDILRETLPASFHIAAGEYVDEPADQRGFDACGKGRTTVKRLMPYGRIGSHGGWGHNWFANKIRRKEFGKDDIKRYIVKNNECLSEQVGYDITEYAAPNGLFPQPESTHILQELGMESYYYAGDNGSVPNRTFFDGYLTSKDIIAFPVMAFGTHASLMEMAWEDVPGEDVLQWLTATADFCAKTRTVRTMYSHFYDLADHFETYGPAFDKHMDQLEQMQLDEKLIVNHMTYFSTFLRKFLKTDFVFNLKDKQIVFEISNPMGLNQITLALPRNRYRPPKDDLLDIEEDDSWYYITFKGTFHEKSFVIESY